MLRLRKVVMSWYQEIRAQGSQTSNRKIGRLPTTDQAVTALNNLSESGALQKASEGMSLEGKKVCLTHITTTRVMDATNYS